MKFLKKSVKGRNKERINELSITKKNEEKYFAGIARGKKGCKFGYEGAEITLNIIYNYMLKQDTETFMDSYQDQKKYELMEQIRNGVKETAKKYQADPEEFSCNFCGICLDEKKEKFILFHLGDGEIYGMEPTGKYRRISAPEYGPTIYHTYHTMTDGSIYHIRFMTGDIRIFDRLYFYSEGAKRVSRYLKTAEGKDILEDFDENKMIKLLEKYKLSEDASILIMTNI